MKYHNYGIRKLQNKLKDKMVITPDMFNGIFEFIGSLMLWLNVRSLYLDKEVKGINKWTVGFFTSWGFWNLFYYTSINQPYSFYGGVSLVTANTVWLILMIYYKRKNLKVQLEKEILNVE